jgi:hypothetical protein
MTSKPEVMPGQKSALSRSLLISREARFWTTDEVLCERPDYFAIGDNLEFRLQTV